MFGRSEVRSLTMKRRRWIIISVLALIGAGLAWGLFERIRSQRALRAYKADLVAKGEKLTIQELAPVLSPQGKRAAAEFLLAAAQLRAGAVVPYNLPGAMQFISPGVARVGWAQPDIRSSSGTNHTWDELQRQLTENETALQRIRETLNGHELDFGLDYTQGFNLMLPPLAPRQRTVQWLFAAALNDLHNGRLDSAVENARAMLALRRGLSGERVLLSQILAAAVAAIAFQPTWEALQADGWTDAQLARLQEAWESPDFIKPTQQFLEMERAGGIDTFERLRRSTAEWRKFSAFSFTPAGSATTPATPPGNSTVVGEFFDSLGLRARGILSRVRETGEGAMWQWSWSYRDELGHCSYFQTVIELLLDVQRAGHFAGVPEALNQAEAILMSDSPPFSVSAMKAPGMSMAVTKAARMETQRKLAVTAIALKRYQLRHGRPAPNLAALVPEFLPQVPRDFMDGNELRYRINVDGTFLLYSVNEDGKDDGGDPRPPTDKSRSRHFANGRDLVWPRAATAAELADEEGPRAPSNE